MIKWLASYFSSGEQKSWRVCQWAGPPALDTPTFLYGNFSWVKWSTSRKTIGWKGRTVRHFSAQSEKTVHWSVFEPRRGWRVFNENMRRPGIASDQLRSGMKASTFLGKTEQGKNLREAHRFSMKDGVFQDDSHEKSWTRHIKRWTTELQS